MPLWRGGRHRQTESLGDGCEHSGNLGVCSRFAKRAVAATLPRDDAGVTLALMPSPRLAVRAILLREDRLLLVNAWKGRTHLWTCPGGGVELHQSLPDALIREVREETGLLIEVGKPCLLNEFHDPKGSFHQVDIYFRGRILSGDPDGAWTDPEGIVSHRRWVSRAEMARITVKPESLAAVAWGDEGALLYDPLEPIVR